MARPTSLVFSATHPTVILLGLLLIAIHAEITTAAPYPPGSTFKIPRGVKIRPVRKSPLPPGTIVGIVFGCIAAFVVLLVTALWIDAWWTARTEARNGNAGGKQEEDPAGMLRLESGASSVTEMSSAGYRQEMERGVQVKTQSRETLPIEGFEGYESDGEQDAGIEKEKRNWRKIMMGRG